MALSAVALVALVAGCGGGSVAPGTTEATAASSATGAEPAPGTHEPITVFAAASLDAALTELTGIWAEDHGNEVRFSFGGSNGLVDQLVEGAPADVLVTADTATMDRAVGDGVAEGPRSLATNSLVLALAPGNPGGFETAEEALTGERLVVCAPEVPCGRATVALMELNGITITPVSEEQSVTDVRGKVSSGEANSGITYGTDATTAGLDALDIPGASDVVTSSVTARVGRGAEAGASFIEFLHSEAARTVLDSYGFGTP
nr:molybdate ABC transporter substrate-binding protein [Actinomycetales bacterium]